MSDATEATAGRSVRWWPLVAIVVIGGAGLAWAWLGPSPMRQMRVMQTIIFGGGAVVASIAWLLLFSRLPSSLRLKTACLFAVLGALGAAMIDIKGVSGDFVPRFGWRWSDSSSGATPTPAAPTPSPDAALVPPPGLVRDYPQFLGPDRYPVLQNIPLATDWNAQPPKPLWRQPTGKGWSSFAVVAGRAVTQEQRGPKEAVTCYELATGRLLWVHEDDEYFTSTIAGDGPRATPTIHGPHVYTLGSTGRLNCLELESGKRLWTADVLADQSMPGPVQWGVAASPLVLDNLVIVTAPGPDAMILVAYDRATGKLQWIGDRVEPSYGSPTVAELAGVKQLVMLNHHSATGHGIDGGKILWQHPWPGDQPKTTQPLILDGDRVFVSSGYGVGCAMLKIARAADGSLAATELWHTTRMRAKYSNAVFHSGHIFGLDDGVLACIDPDTGQRKWRGGNYKHGHVILVDDLLLITTEWGEVVLVRADPEAHHELTRFQAVEGKTWNTPALAGQYLLVRSDDEAACYELPLRVRTAN